jgi:pyruvate-ferredoxin/flavodoxin oxidoreductase
VAKLDDLIDRLEKHVRMKLAETMDVSDPKALNQVLNTVKEGSLTLSSLSDTLSRQPIDAEWLHRVSQLLSQLKHLRWQYTTGTTGNGRAAMGIVNSTGCSSVWGSTWPYNPYPFPWANHLFQDSPSMAMGLFEGHMAKMAEGFKAVRKAELELDGEYEPDKHDAMFQYFDWHQFTDEEFRLCPPVVVIGGDGALYDIGFQNLSRLLMSGKPVKVMTLDTQVYSNTGGQACTSGFIGQVSDMAQYGKAQQGKEEVRKEFGLITAAHRTSFMLQGSTANTSHLIEGFINGLNTKRPAVFNIYCPCMPEHGIADDMSKHQSRLAIESRAYPIWTFDPDRGKTFAECINLEGNPAQDQLWPSYKLNYVSEDGTPAEMELPLTFADFAVTEARFRKHFKKAPRETWNDDMVHVAEFITLSEEEREDKFPFIWAVDNKQRLTRLIVSLPVVKSCEERLDFWLMLRALGGVEAEEVDLEAIKQQARAEVATSLAQGLLQLAGGGNGGAATLPAAAPAQQPAVSTADVQPAAATPPAPAQAEKPQPEATTPAAAAATPAGSGNGQMPSIESVECTACGECIQVNPKMFAYNAKKQAEIVDPTAGTFKDLVKAAEKCPSRAIHPGDPLDPNEKGLEKLLKRAAKFNA